MSRKPRRKEEVCVYCGNTAVCTDDHVIPSCLFPKDEIPIRSEFVIVPACEGCNRKKGREDAYVRDYFSADMKVEGHPTVRRVLPAVFRAAQKNRSDLMREFLTNGRFVRVQPDSSGIPVFRPVARLKWERVSAFFRFVVRGLHWKHFGERIPDNFSFLVQTQNEELVTELIGKPEGNHWKGAYGVGEGVFHYVFQGDLRETEMMIWLFFIYDSIYVTVSVADEKWLSEQLTFPSK